MYPFMSSSTASITKLYDSGNSVYCGLQNKSISMHSFFSVPPDYATLAMYHTKMHSIHTMLSDCDLQSQYALLSDSAAHTI